MYVQELDKRMFCLSSIILCCYLTLYLHKEVPEGHKCRSVLGFRWPALQHDIINVLWTVLWFDKPLSLPIDLMENLYRGAHIQMSHKLYLQKNRFQGQVWEYTWLPLSPTQGSCPWVNISHNVTPNIQVSLAWEKVRVFRLSGAHLQRTELVDRGWGN